MILPDVNVLVRAFQSEGQGGRPTLEWLEDTLNGEEPFAVWDSILVSTYRILTLPKFVRDLNTSRLAMEFLQQVRDASVVVNPGDRYWRTFRNLIEDSRATGNLVTDAGIAAVAIENRCRLATFDRDFARFPGLQWFEPPI